MKSIEFADTVLTQRIVEVNRASASGKRSRGKQEVESWSAHGFVSVGTANGSWFCRPGVTCSLKHIEKMVTRCDASTEWRVIKRTDERLVAQCQLDDFPEPILIKARRQRRRRTWPLSRQVPNEMLQQLEAAKRGLRVPHVFASGTLGSGRRHDWSIHVMQWLALRTMRDRFLPGPSSAEVQALLERAGVSLLALYKAACNHIDFGPHAILMSNESADEDVIIDFEYATFLTQPSARILAAHMGYFGWSIATNRPWATHDQIHTWFCDLMARCNLEVGPDYEREFIDNLEARQSIRQRAKRTG